MKQVQQRELDPNEILDQAISQGIRDFYVAYSGGKDSGIVLDLISKEFPKNFRGVIFVNTGIATKATVEFVKDYCKKHDYKLNMLYPHDVKRKKISKYGKIGDPFTYENRILYHGFPMSGSHNITMAELKFYPMRTFIGKKIKDGEKPAIISGVRKKESTRRNTRKSYSKYINCDGNVIFVCPLYFKSNDWVTKYWIENDIKRSPVYETLHISGDCLCGCFAKKDELKLLEMFHPDVFKKIKDLENEIKIKGTKEAKKYSTWGNGGNTKDIESQTTIESAVCSDCFFDHKETDKDTKRFNDEFDDIETKLEMVV